MHNEIIHRQFWYTARQGYLHRNQKKLNYSSTRFLTKLKMAAIDYFGWLENVEQRKWQNYCKPSIKHLKENMMRVGSPMTSYIANKLGENADWQFPWRKVDQRSPDSSVPLLMSHIAAPWSEFMCIKEFEFAIHWIDCLQAMCRPRESDLTQRTQSVKDGIHTDRKSVV